VIAHEVRNPLMIIKASLRTLGSERVSRDERRQALTDVDESGPPQSRGQRRSRLRASIRFDCAASVSVSTPSRPPARLRRMSASHRRPALRPLVTDGERLRAALSASSRTPGMQYWKRRAGSDPSPAPISKSLPRPPRRAAFASRCAIGVWASAEDLAHLRPCFTTNARDRVSGLAIAETLSGMGGAVRRQPAGHRHGSHQIAARREGMPAPPRHRRHVRSRYDPARRHAAARRR
jgi:hypothetical protein